MDIKFLTQENEIQKLYSKFGLVVPVGDLETGKAPAIQPLPAEVTNDKVTFNFNVMSNAEITEISYETDHMDQGTITPKKGMISISFDRNPIDTMYEIGITVTNENGSTYAGQLAEFPIIPDWATANEVLEGNKFIGEDGQESVGTYVPESGPGTGGATVQSCTMDYVSDPGMGEYPRYSIVLDTMPADIDPENHRYYAGVFALCYNADPFSDGDFEHLANVSGQSRAEFDLENNTIYDYFGAAPTNQYYQEISSTSGCVVLYDGSIDNPIYKWPCTITIPANPQQ